MEQIPYSEWLTTFLQTLRAFLLGDAQSKTLPVTALRPFPVRAEGDEKKQFTRAQIVTAVRSWLDIGVNGGEGTRPDGEVVEINGYKAFNDLNPETLSDLGLAAALQVTHKWTPRMGKNKGVEQTYSTMAQTVKRIMAANTPKRVSKGKRRKLTAQEKDWLRTNVGKDWWGVGTTDPVRKAESIARMDAEMGAVDAPTEEVATPSNPVAETTAEPVSGVTARVVELRKEFPNMSVAEAKELAEAGL